MTAAAILARIEAERTALRGELASDAAEDSFYRLARVSRIDALSNLLSWLPKELDRLVIETRDEESTCLGCDEPEAHGGPCYQEDNSHRLASCGRGGPDCYCDCQPCQVSHWPDALRVHDVPREVAVAG